MKPAKEKNGISDEECRPAADQPALCAAHGQPTISCANDRMKQVKEARVMADRRTRWAIVWKEVACATRKEINKLKEAECPASPKVPISGASGSGPYPKDPSTGNA